MPKTKIHVNFNGQDLKLPYADPQLPPELVRSFESDSTCPPYRSVIFIPEFNVIRHLIASGEQCPEAIIQTDMALYMRQTIGFLPGAPYLVNKSTGLHLAATTGDIPLFYEMVRLGCHLEVTDEHGRTPLFAGCERLSSLMLNGKVRTFPGANSTRLRNDVKRIEKVCILLVEQHATLDTKINGKTPLHLACATNSWDLIKVLLQHGADPAPTSLPRSQHCISLFRTFEEKERFKAIYQLPHRERPPRPCPCWSGKLLRDCHARESDDKITYPLHFICRCKSRKTFEKCCHKRGVLWTEAWDPEEMWIQPFRCAKFVTSTAQARENLMRQLEVVGNFNQSIADGTSLMSGADVISGVKSMTAKMMDLLVQSEHVDPGFAYAAKKVDFMPRPWSNGIPKVEQKIRMNEWNTAVDEYIASGVDMRMREDIEVQCKIGISGGPLHPWCENETCNEEPEGCNPSDGLQPTKLLLCVGCKKVKYCSKECQRQAWAAHKSVCKSGKAEEQLLQSQQAITQMYEFMMNDSH